MRGLLIILSIFICTVQLHGQEVNRTKTEDIAAEITKIKQLEFNQKEKYLNEKQIAGSPYLDKKFQKAYILKTNGAEIKDMYLRYNIYNDDMEFEKDGKIMSIAFPLEIARINMSGIVFIHKPYTTARNVSVGYFQVLYEGDYQLLKKYQVMISSPSERTHPGDSLSFERKLPHFYLRYGDGMAHLVNSRKTLIKVLQPIPQNIIDYIKSNGINTRDEKQLVDLMDYMDQTKK